MRHAVIAGDGPTALGLLRGLGAHGVPCIICAWNARGPAQYSPGVPRVACPPPPAGEALVRVLVDLARSLAEPPVLFATDEATVLVFERWRAVIEGSCRLASPTADKLMGLVSKLRLAELAAAAGVPAPRIWPLGAGDTPPDLPYPVVIKPEQRVIWDRHGCLRSFRVEFGGKALAVQDRAALRQLAGRAASAGFALLAQEFVGGGVTRLETTGVFRGADGRRAVFTARKLVQVPEDFGEGAVVEALPIDDLPAFTWRLLDYVGYAGIADVEYKRDCDGRPLLLDVNPRPWPWIDLGTRAGVNLPYLAYCEAAGCVPAPAIPAQSPQPVSWCSPKALLLGLWSERPGYSLRRLPLALRHGYRAASAAPRANRLTFARMLASPSFWADTLRRKE